MIVAEISCNHGGEKKRAMDLIDIAKEVGADAVKFQLFWPEEMAWQGGEPLASGRWAGSTLFDLYERAWTPAEWFSDLFAHARDIGIEPFASVFSERGIELLEKLDVKRYKIASAEAAWPELAELVVATGKLIIVSDGMAMTREIMEVIGTRAWRRTWVLRCVSEYPAPADHYGFGACMGRWGLSDHSMEPRLAGIATALGAEIIEAHLKDGIIDTLDYDHSYTPELFRLMVEGVRMAEWAATSHGAIPDINSPFRRRWVWTRDAVAGSCVDRNDMAVLRHPDGADPLEWHLPNEGAVLKTTVKAGTGVDPAVFKE